MSVRKWRKWPAASGSSCYLLGQALHRDEDEDHHVDKDHHEDVDD